MFDKHDTARVERATPSEARRRSADDARCVSRRPIDGRPVELPAVIYRVGHHAYAGAPSATQGGGVSMKKNVKNRVAVH
jgi:hypothetical protein